MAIAEHPLQVLIRRLSSFSELSQDDREAILALPYTLKMLEPSTYIVREGEPPLQCGMLVSGFAYRQKLTGEGSRQIVALHIPGDALDFQNIFLRIADHNVQTLTRAEIAFVPRVQLRDLARGSQAIGHAILISTLIEAAIFREWVLNVGRRNARARLAHLLCELATRLDAAGLADEYGYELPMTQEQLGDTLGLTPVHVNRTLRALEADGLIERNKRKVVFPDWRRLREVADFNDRYLHLTEFPQPIA